MTRTPTKLAFISVLAALFLLAVSAAPAMAGSGGLSDQPDRSGPTGKAKLKSNGKAIAPSDAPARVKKAIRAGNEIRRKPYKWGGGHGSFKDNGYDCSGGVSYVLHGAKMLNAPLASGPLESWGKKGKGRWITVYANSGHTYVIVAGLRFDTAGGDGPRWHKDMRSKSGYSIRHKGKL